MSNDRFNVIDIPDFNVREETSKPVHDNGEEQKWMAAAEGEAFPIREPHPLAEGAD